MKTVIQTDYAEHPMEGVLDLEPCTTLVEYTEVIPDIPVEHVAYDEKDSEIETRIEEVYSIAIEAATTLSDEVDRVEGKYKARMGEVSATMLNVALGAIREKRQLKEHKDKLSTSPKGGPHTVNNNLVVADRNDILRALMTKTDK